MEITALQFPTPFGVVVRHRKEYRVPRVRPERVVSARRVGSTLVQTRSPDGAAPASPERRGRPSRTCRSISAAWIAFQSGRAFGF
jgi:hypothetical protein